jgi:acetyltransferase-like isoleucine patch superfamily enzyme
VLTGLGGRDKVHTPRHLDEPRSLPIIERVSPHARVRHRRLTMRHARAFVRWLWLRVAHRNFRCGLFLIDDGAHIEIGRDIDIDIEPGVLIRRDYTGFWHEGRLHIGRDTQISRGVYMSVVRGIDIGENCLIAEGVSIHDMDHDFGADVADTPLRQRMLRAAPISIGNNVWIGAKATVVRGVTIGDDVVIAANAVVVDDIPSHCVAGGIPARVLKSWGPESGIRSGNEGTRSNPGWGAEPNRKELPC